MLTFKFFHQSIHKIKIILLYVCISSCIFSCFPPSQEQIKTTDYELTDTQVQKILNYQDERATDSLINFFNNEDPKYRYLAVKSFSSIKDSNAIPALINMLDDNLPEIQTEAANSLGQIGNVKAEKSLINHFIAVDSIGPYIQTNAAILIALGRCGSDSTLALISNIKSYGSKDTLLVNAQMQSLFRFAMRGKFNTQSLDRVFSVLEADTYTNEAKLYAAHYLLRFKELNISNYFDRLKKLCINEKNSEIRMCLVGAMSRIGTAESLSQIEELYTRGLDVRIQSNLFRGINTGFKNGLATNFAIRAVQNPSLHVAIPAAEYLAENGSATMIDEYKNLADQVGLPWQVKAIIYTALFRKIPAYMTLTRDGYIYRLKELINNSKSNYEKAAYIKALSEIPTELNYILTIYNSRIPAVINLAIAESAQKIIDRNDFTLIYKGNKNYIYQQLANYFSQNCLQGDQGVLSIMASIFKKEKFLLEKYVRPDSIMLMGQAKLKLPRDIETYNDVDRLITERYKKSKFVSQKIKYNHPIDWKKMSSYPDTINAIITTSKGDIGIILMTKSAPASVYNFISLVKDNYFKEKYFHRVVPNFVVQVGCPRGDGYGSLDYTIRTEISSLNYLQSGMIGMASAGNDTESCQFFITHSPTPHLDGNYTVFGKVLTGFEVLMTIQQGDKIIDVKINETK